jgi:predicted GNAT family N-acyltransferase
MEFNFPYLLAHFELRELKNEADLADHLALRSKIYHKEYSGQYVDNHYDLLPSDWKSNLIGIFFEGRQIATIRVVKRHVNAAIEKQLTSINQKFGLGVAPDLSDFLPTEYAFDLKSEKKPDFRETTVELSRVAVSDEFRGWGLCRFAMLAAVGISILDNSRYCLYSCSVNSVQFHADLLPMMKGITVEQNDNGYPGFKFPASSAAVLSEIQQMTQKHINQAILAGIVCRYGIGVLGDSFSEKAPSYRISVS